MINCKYCGKKIQFRMTTRGLPIPTEIETTEIMDRDGLFVRGNVLHKVNCPKYQNVVKEKARKSASRRTEPTVSPNIPL